MIRAGWDRLRLFNIGELLAHRGRTLMSMIVMGVSAGLLVSVFSISGSITGSVDRLARSLSGDAVLEISGITDAGFEQSLLQEVRGVAGVGTAVPMLRAPIGADADRALLIGADASAAALGSDLDGPLREQAAKLPTVRHGVLVGTGMGYAEGESFDIGGTTVTVAGVLDDPAARKLNDGHLVITLLPVAQQITDRAGRLDSIQIIAAPDTDVAQLRSALTDVVDGRAVVADPGMRAAQAGGAVQVVTLATLASSAAALIVSSFLIYNAMSMAVAQRRPMLSLLRAIGGRRAPMVRDLVAESALLGLIGGLVGAAVGVFMGRIAIHRLPAAMLNSVEARTEFILPGYAVPVAVAACVVASVTAAALAARQVYKVAPIEALAPVGTSSADRTSPVLRWGAVVLGTALTAAAIVIADADLGRISMAAVSMAIAGAVMFCFAATGPIVRGTAAVARLFGAPGALGATTVERAPRRVWATAMTVMIGVTAVVAIGNATRNMADSASESFAGLGTTDVFISPTAMEQFPTGPILPADLKEKIAAIPGVAGAGSAQMAFATLGGGRVMLQAFEEGQGRQAATAALSADTLRRMAAGEGIVVSRDVARTLAVQRGSTLELPTPSGIHRVEVLEVVPYFSAIAGVVMLDLDILRQWYQRPGETIIGVDFLPDADPDQVFAAIRAAVPPEIHVDTGPEAVAAISASVSQGTSLSTSILWIVVAVSTIALLNTLMLSVLERRRELGVLRAMGTSRRFLLRTVLTEAAGIGVVGAAIGLAVGAAVHYLATITMSSSLSLDVEYQPSPLLLVYAVVALLLALLGSIPPAVRAARLPIVEAIAAD
ncbi:ABC transporter permease [Nocardia otitidiscaviarum]|uniref:ABC transporter permease n=1 Tax=Nocardia otitidiscaviarum TaxID=1823 RepID=A0A516NQ11_9NOCA|nr:ABC transporter permease [Nocardia otitidiscaviarum]MCP9623722.1 ABC transporter permease [Nocardia otitidiscaviarum]QDP80974.1 ABC transporter permease [Nocardia otitidiscaviarum]